ncbi:MAG: tRNA (adenosine(37)-N6)-threonylcarbamoyltransferase complex dimerization subunit type 1 TsaB [Prevotellaceae bacterium]|jgi:tRNA threonylcarbamoyladenosine biosynthesis protein TsaB|nr:tRNA (adenosine(37)-N6)-threonylcarbamoyltransferase complex dimerization subunit type 1 TsaB [Prevotellaceae bacterium]
MPLILNIETGTEICSVALAKDGQLLALAESDKGMEHGKLLSPFIDKVLKEQGTTTNNLDAVAVSEGPGSYTGLRIGVATAKGICYGADKPLIAVNSLQSLAMLAIEQNIAVDLLCPMIDARRMEVYTAFFDLNGNLTGKVSAQIIEENSYSELLENKRIAFFGNGAEKCKPLIQSANAIFLDIKHSARGMMLLANKKLKINDFVDTAYFEPFYLKDFVATTSKKRLF